MTSLYFRFFGLLVFTLLGSIVIQEINVALVRNWAIADEISSGSVRTRREQFLPIFQLIERQIVVLDESDWAKRFDAVKQGLSRPMSLLSVQKLPSSMISSPTWRDELMTGHIVWSPMPAGEYALTKRIGKSEHAISIRFIDVQSRREYWRRVGSVANALIEIVFFAVFSFLLLRSFWKDLRALDYAARLIGEGKYETQIALSTNSALAALGRTLSAMKERISALIASHKSLTVAVSHEFRNPLMRVRFRQTLARDAKTIALKNEHLDQMEKDLHELDGLSDELLIYAKLDTAEPMLEISTIAVDALLNEAVQRARSTAESIGSIKEIRSSSSVEVVQGDRRFIERAVDNLLSNAVRFATSSVLVSVCKEDAWIIVRVDDDGPGIAQPDRGKVFDPFVRLDKSRNRATGGYGMGLAIVERIASWHLGTIEVVESPLGGARFVLSWPEP